MYCNFALFALAFSQSVPTRGGPKSIKGWIDLGRNFFVAPAAPIKPFDQVPISIGQFDFTWNHDSCAGAIDGNLSLILGNGNLVLDAEVKDGICVDLRGDPLGPADPVTVFPRGFSKVEFRKLFSSEQTFDLLPGLSNGAQLVGVTRKLTLNNLSRFPTGYYNLVIEATDSLGGFVRGTSPIIVIRNSQPLEAVSSLLLIKII
jgi:hypothetical protein